MEYDVEKIWSAVLSALKLSISEASFKTFFSKMKLLEIKPVGDRALAVIACSTGMIKETVEKRFIGQVADELSRVIARTTEVQLVVRTIVEPKHDGLLEPLFAETRSEDDRWRYAGLREDYTFDLYAVGGSNQMAFAAAQAVAKRPGQAYNPLFIYGGVGVGKTHLMQAIGHEIVKQGEMVRCCTGEEFTNDLVEAIRYKTTEKVRAKYRRVKLLLIDDVQFIAGKPSVQEEFFHTFNAIQKDGGQVIMTSDRPPMEIAKLEERLRSRFGAGLIVDVGQPDFELRTAIILIKSKQLGVELPMETAQLIANHIEGIRELQGFLSMFMTSFNNQPLDLSVERAKVLLKIPSNGTGVTKLVSPQDVLGMICTFYGVTLSQLKSERRTKSLAWPRQVAMYFLNREMNMAQEEVGRIIGGRDHSTVIHARDKVLLELETNEGFKREFDSLKKKILAG